MRCGPVYLASAHPFAKGKGDGPGRCKVTRKLNPQKPYNLRRWKLDTSTGIVHYFTCGRPGREKGPKALRVCDELVHNWVLGLQEYCGPNLAIISLLGRKRDGSSEFSFYSFYGGSDTTAERKGRPSLQEWLETHHKALGISVYEFPTTDRSSVPVELRDSVVAQVKELFLDSRHVVVVDSAGAERTGRIHDHLCANFDRN